MPQPTLQQLFAASNKKGKSGFSTASASAEGDDGTAGTSKRRATEQQLKENTPCHQTAVAAAAYSKDSKLCQAPGVHGAHAVQQNSKLKNQPVRNTQLFLDLGQRDFGASCCSECGMVYTKGLDEDEKLHKAYHQGALQGFKFQGWSHERVLMSEVAQGRLLLVLQTDPATHVKKVRELCAYVEKAHGMSQGWLLSPTHARVFLYVSSQRRIVGLAVMEPLKQAYKVAAAAGTLEQEVDSTQTSQHQQRRQQASLGSILDDPAAAMQPPPPQKRRQQQLLWPGLQKRGRLAALGRAAGSGGSVLCSDPSLHSASGGASCSMKADSCPTSLLAAAGQLHVQADTSSGALLAGAAAAAGTAETAAANAGPGPPTTQTAAVPEQPSSSGAAACDAVMQEATLMTVSQQHAQQEAKVTQQLLQQQWQQLGDRQPATQPGPSQSQQQQPTSAALLSPQAPAMQVSELHRQLLPWQKGAAASIPSSSSTPGSTATGAAAAAAVDDGTQRAADMLGSGGSSIRRGSKAAGAAAVTAASGSRSLLVDKRRAMRAMVGVRMVWVLPEQRRQGVATKLLDGARCNMVPGYVVPSNQVAFNQPTGDGVALAAAFTGTQQFLVYGME